MKERVSIRRAAPKGYLAVNSDAIGKERGVVFSIVMAALTGEPVAAGREHESFRRSRRP